LEGTAFENGDDEIELFLKGSATFLSLPQLIKILERQPGGKKLIIHVDQLAHLDHACVEVLQNWERQYAQTGGSLTVAWQHLDPAPKKKNKVPALV
jgi:ABC-type transporter Mla MlaB component